MEEPVEPRRATKSHEEPRRATKMPRSKGNLEKPWRQKDIPNRRSRSPPQGVQIAPLGDQDRPPRGSRSSLLEVKIVPPGGQKLEK